MGKASRRKRTKKESLDLESYRQFFPSPFEEVAISTTGWCLPLTPELIKKLVSERGWPEFPLYQLMRYRWTYCPQTDCCYEGYINGKRYAENPSKVVTK